MEEDSKTNIELFIENIINKFSDNKKINIEGKTLHYLSENNETSEVINFSFYIYGNTEINPFLLDIIIDLEFVPNKTPYARIRSDFTLPSLYDNRNYYFCLTNENDYIYDPKQLEKIENILNTIINSGIENFLFCIKESLQVNTFIYYGEYKLNSTYNMNDFLENNKLIKLYRINQILEKGKDIEEKYILFTQLYILIFKPNSKDKSYAELIFMKQLKNIIFNYKKNFNKKLNRHTFMFYIQDIKTPNGKTYEMEFELIDRSRPSAIVEEELKVKEDIINENKNLNDNESNNTNNITKKGENDIWDKYIQFEEEIEKKQKEINFNKYKLILESYRPLFNHRSNIDKKEKGIQNKNKIMDYEKMFKYCEKMYNYYEKMNDNKNYKKRMEYYIININFFCAELMGFYDMEKASFKFYFDKMKYYLNLNEKHQ